MAINISSEQFKSIKTAVRVSNATTRIPFKNNPRPQIVEFADQGLSLQAPERSCATGHLLMLEIRLTAPGRAPLDLTATAKVLSIEPNPDGTETLQLQLMQHERDKWLELLKVFSGRQDAIEEYFAKVVRE